MDRFIQQHYFHPIFYILAKKYQLFDSYDQLCNQSFHDKNFEVYNLLKNLVNIYNKAYANIHMAQNKRYKYYNRKSKLRNICIKDIVYLNSIDKLKPKYTGPYIVIENFSLVSVFKQLHSSDNSAFRVYTDRLLLAPPRKNNPTNYEYGVSC